MASPEAIATGLMAVPASHEVAATSAQAIATISQAAATRTSFNVRFYAYLEFAANQPLANSYFEVNYK